MLLDFYGLGYFFSGIFLIQQEYYTVPNAAELAEGMQQICQFHPRN